CSPAATTILQLPESCTSPPRPPGTTSQISTPSYMWPAELKPWRKCWRNRKTIGAGTVIRNEVVSKHLMCHGGQLAAGVQVSIKYGRNRHICAPGSRPEV